MVLDRVLAEVVAVADLRDRQPPRPQANDLSLPLGQRRQRGSERGVIPSGRQRPVATRAARLPAVSHPSWMSTAVMEGKESRSVSENRSVIGLIPAQHRPPGEHSPITLCTPRRRPRPVPRSWRRARRARPAGDASRSDRGSLRSARRRSASGRRDRSTPPAAASSPAPRGRPRPAAPAHRGWRPRPAGC